MSIALTPGQNLDCREPFQRDQPEFHRSLPGRICRKVGAIRPEEKGIFFSGKTNFSGKTYFLR